MISIFAALQRPIRLSFMIRSAILTLGVLFCLMPQTALAEEFPPCRLENYLKHFDPRLEPQACEVMTTAPIRWRSGAVTLRAIRLSSAPITDSSVFIDHIRQAAAAIGTALDRMEGSLELNDITILFSSYVSPREPGPHGGFQKGDYLAAAHGPYTYDCPVIYYKYVAPEGGEGFIFHLAHEAFHCVQYNNWPSVRQGWLVEGSPEYFAFMVKPDFGSRFIPNFNHDIPTIPLDRLEYEAAPFYLWLGNLYGPPRVREFLDSAGTIESLIPPDMLSEFAKAYFGPTIRMPDGRAMPSSPAAPATRSVRSSMRIASPVVTPYTLKSELITFERGNIYELSTSTAPADARTAWRMEPGGAFGEMPTRISTCDGEKQFLVVRTTTTSRRAGDITVTAQPPSSSPCACPMGTWQETAISAKRYFEQKGLGIYSGDESTKYLSGGRTLILDPDHTGSFTYVNVETVTTGSGDLTLHQVKTGGSHFTWKVVNGTLLTVLSGSNNLLTLDNQLITRDGTTSDTRHAPAQSIGHAFTCNDTGLHLTQIAPPPGLRVSSTFNTKMDFVRAGPMP